MNISKRSPASRRGSRRCMPAPRTKSLTNPPPWSIASLGPRLASALEDCFFPVDSHRLVALLDTAPTMTVLVPPAAPSVLPPPVLVHGPSAGEGPAPEALLKKLPLPLLLLLPAPTQSPKIYLQVVDLVSVSSPRYSPSLTIVPRQCVGAEPTC